MGNRKKLFAIMLVFALAITGSYAMLVNYLSNEVEATVTVESPIELQVYGDNGWSTATPITLDNMYGADTVTMIFKEINLNPDTEIEGKIRVEIRSDNISLEDITSLTYTEFYADGVTVRYENVPLTLTLVEDSEDSEENMLIVEADTILLSGQNNVRFNADLTFAPAVIGAYEVDVRVIPE